MLKFRLNIVGINEVYILCTNHFTMSGFKKLGLWMVGYRLFNDAESTETAIDIE
jgi:hypothetical protein